MCHQISNSVKISLYVFVLSLFIVSSVVNADVLLTVNGNDASVQPLELKASEQILIGLSGGAELKQKKYDLSMTAIGGTLQESTSLTNKKNATTDTVQITTDSLGSAIDYIFSFSDDTGMATINLVTNTDMTIDGIEAPVGTTIYELILFELPEAEQVVIFGISYEALSYTPPVQEESSSQPLQAELPESMDLGGESIMMSMGSQQEEPIWFGNPAQCPDLDDDNFVNFVDFAIFAGNWMQTGTELSGDFDEDGSVDINDLGHFCEYWLMPVDCPEYYADELPFLTSFEKYQGFEPEYSLDYQMGWKVAEGEAIIDYWWYELVPEDYYYYQYTTIDVNSIVTKDFNDTGSNHQYIRFSFIPAIDQKINVVNGSDVVASVWFNSSGYIYVLDNGSYVNTNVSYASVYNDCWYYYGNSYDYDNTWTDIKFKMDWSSDTYELYWNGGTTDIANDADFDDDYDELTGMVLDTDADWSVLNSCSISDQSSGGLSMEIDSPCACHDDLELKGRVPIEGTAWGENFGKYDIYICPTDLDTGTWDNWTNICTGSEVVPSIGILGYWDTSLIPNGTYFVGIVLFDDVGYAENGFEIIWKTITIGGQTVYEGPGYFPVVGELKGNTFYHEEEPDISVPWSGQFPFELRRSFNNNRRLYNKPFRYGWTHNSQITLQEDATYRAETEQSGPFTVASWDQRLLGMGYVWIQNPDGSRRLFRHTTGHDSSNPVLYYPYPDDGSGDYIERYSYDDWGIIYEIDYYLIKRDGTRLYFYTEDVDIPAYGPYGAIGWSAKMGISSMTDRFGNGLGFGWNYDKTAVTSISDGHATIQFTLQDGYYTKAELKVGQDVYRTIEYDWDSNNKIYTVTKSGYGVNENGVYSSVTEKEYETEYQYEEISGSGYNLTKVAYGGNVSEPSIEVDYDDYSRVDTRKDYIDTSNYLLTEYDYTFYHPNPSNKEISYLITDIMTPYQKRNILQNEKGNMLQQRFVPEDSSAVTDVNIAYEDSSNPLKPTDVNEFFDGMERYTWKDYNYYGDLIEQKVYLDDVNYIATELDYHPSYSLPIRQTSWQDVNESGPIVEKLSIYGEANGLENEYSKYLVQEKVMLSEDPNVWAVTSYAYYDNGLMKTQTDPNGFMAFYEYDDNDFRKFVRKGTADSNEPVQRFYHDDIGQMRLAANSLGGVILSDYDDFGRLWRVRKYSDSSAMTINDATFVPSRYEAMSELSTITFGYDSKGNRTYEQKEAGGTISTDYTIGNQPETVTYDDSSYIEYSYDPRGLKTQEHKYDANTTQDYNTVYSYDDMDRLIQTIWYDYDDVNTVRAVSSEYYGSSRKKYDYLYGQGYLEKCADYDYDILGRLIKRIIGQGSLNIMTQYDYDAANNRISIIDPNSNIIYAKYDNANRKIVEYFAAVSGTDIEDANVSKEYWYYENGKVRDANSYDYDGTLLAHSNFEYDSLGRIIEATQDINDTDQAETTYYYDDSGFTYDSNEYHIRITDAESKDTYIALDEFGKRIKTLYPSDDYEHLEYNPDGTLAMKAVWDVNDEKQWIEYYYDGYGRLVDTNYPDTGNVHYTYDGFGRKILVEDNRNSTDNIGGSEEIAYGYDVLGRITSVTDHDDYETTYAYQADGQKQAIQVYAPNDTLIYYVDYSYDDAGRLEVVTEPLMDSFNNWIAQFGYNYNGNRSQLKYYLTGSFMGSTASIDYAYDRDNHLIGYSTTGGPTFTFDANNGNGIDGLGRLIDANETITKTDSGTVNHSYSYNYDMLGRLIYAYASDVAPTPAREYEYDYDKVGNMTHYMFNDYDPDAECHYYYTYTGDLRTGKTGAKYCEYDKNGRQTSLWQDDQSNDFPVERDWEGRIRWNKYLLNDLGSEAKYTPDRGIRTWKKYNWNMASYEHKYIVDMSGKIPNILLVIDVNDANSSILKTYLYANDQVICQHDGSYEADRYFYLHDRLGNVREVIDTSADVQNCYFYTPWGGTTGSETDENVDNWHGFAGYYYDDGLDSYYCNARWYYGGRFMSRDTVKGSYNEPMTLHPYLYCLNDPINATDPSGEFLGLIGAMSIRSGMSGYKIAGAGLAMGYMGMLYEMAGARAAVTNMLINMTYEGETRDYGWNDPRNLERQIYDWDQGMQGDPGNRNKDPRKWWQRIILNLLELIDSFKG